MGEDFNPNTHHRCFDSGIHERGDRCHCGCKSCKIWKLVRTDEARLDWLEKATSYKWKEIHEGFGRGEFESIRDAIDYWRTE